MPSRKDVWCLTAVVALTVVATRTHRASLAGRFPLSRRERGFMQERQRRTEAAVRAYERAAQRFDASRLEEASAAARDLSAAARRGDAAVVSILDHGAAGDGRGDDAPALRRAVAAAAGATAPRVVVHLPAGRTYKMSAVVLADVEDLELRIDGTIRAPPMDRWPARAEPEDETQSPELRRMRYAFLELRRALRVTVTGSGAVEGSGRAWWRVRKRRPSVRAPVLLLVADSRDVAVTHLRLAESPFYHVVVLRSSSVALRRLRVASPPGSVNTDGIDLLSARDVTVDDCWVDTGDDNVAIKEGCVGVEVRGGTFYKGHGLSIGSLGEGGTTASVRDVVLSGVRFVKTSNAARVKTWQGGSGAVANVTFRDLDVRAVGAPVVVDQFYCPASQHPGPCANESKAVAVERVTIDGVTGPRPASRDCFERRGRGRSTPRTGDALHRPRCRLAHVGRRGHAPLLRRRAVRRLRVEPAARGRAGLLQRRPLLEREGRAGALRGGQRDARLPLRPVAEGAAGPRRERDVRAPRLRTPDGTIRGRRGLVRGRPEISPERGLFRVSLASGASHSSMAATPPSVRPSMRNSGT